MQIHKLLISRPVQPGLRIDTACENDREQVFETREDIFSMAYKHGILRHS